MQNLAYDIHTPAPLSSLSGQSSAAGGMRGLVGVDAVLRNAVGDDSFEPIALVGRRVR